ncbi:hypothetical protein DITRI_Ditri14bG0040300 [Diplodiscus trichospermus]
MEPLMPRAIYQSKRKVREPKEEISNLGLAIREGEHVFGVAHIFASFNDTFIPVTDLSGRETMVRITSGMKVKADRDESSPYAAMLAAQDVSQRCKKLGITALHIKLRATGGNKTKTPGPGAQSALRALAHSGMKIGRIAPIERVVEEGEGCKQAPLAIYPAVFVVVLLVQPNLIQRIQEAQLQDARIQAIKGEVESGLKPDFRIRDDGSLRFGDRICVPDSDELKREILEEAHFSNYTIHPGSTKMYQDLREIFWWNNMKLKIAEF